MPEMSGQIDWRASELWLPDRHLKISAFQSGCLVHQLQPRKLVSKVKDTLKILSDWIFKYICMLRFPPPYIDV